MTFSGELVMRGRVLLAIGFVIAALSGCSGGSTDGGSATDGGFSGTEFVADESSTGKLVVDVNSDSFGVGDTEGFSVKVTDVTGRPVANLRISCDSEQGLAIVEPNTGSELTDENGQMSGRVGCAAPGSHLFGCRLPLSGQARKLMRIVCEGPTPENFTGFPNAAGGGLGGGVGAPGNGGQPGGALTDVNIKQLIFRDDGTEVSTKSIDVFQASDCDGEDETFDPEPFFDTEFTASFQNDSNSTVKIVSYRITVDNATGDGTATYRSPSFAVGTVIPPNGGIGSAFGILARAGSVSSETNKHFVGSSSDIPSLITRSVTVSFVIEDSEGNQTTKSLSVVLAFGNYDRCSS